MLKTILLVNPLSATQYISQELKAKGFFTVALFTVSYNDIPAYFRPSKELFDKQIYLETTDTALLLLTVSEYKIDFVLNGNDESLLITEKIINELMPQYSNDINSVTYRSNKFYTQEAFKAHQLPYIQQIKINSTQENFDTSKIGEMIGFPCFIKPVRGAASVGASFCRSYEDLVDKLNHKLYTPTNQLMDEYIVQEIIQGDEIFVDTFSVQGQHYVSSVQTISKQEIENSSCYRSERLVYDPIVWGRAVALVKKALDACGIKNSFSHTELFHLPDGSFRILEINPRHSGAKGLPNSLAKDHKLNTQIDLLANYLNDEEIIESQCHDIQGYGEILYLYNFSQHKTKNIEPQLKQFHSIVQVLPCSEPGSIPTRIKNLSNVDCMLILYSRFNKNLVLEEVQRLWELESIGHLL